MPRAGACVRITAAASRCFLQLESQGGSCNTTARWLGAGWVLIGCWLGAGWVLPKIGEAVGGSPQFDVDQIWLPALRTPASSGECTQPHSARESTVHLGVVALGGVIEDMLIVAEIVTLSQREQEHRVRRSAQPPPPLDQEPPPGRCPRQHLPLSLTLGICF